MFRRTQSIGLLLFPPDYDVEKYALNVVLWLKITQFFKILVYYYIAYRGQFVLDGQETPSNYTMGEVAL